MGNYTRDGRGTVRPYLYAKPDMAEFVESVFGATINARNETPIGVHVEAFLGDSVFILETAEEFPEHINPTTASVYVYVEDVDQTYARAIAAGADSISEPEDKPYDERQCGIRDSFGNTWWIATHLDALK